jgi:DNA repair exonuclease SbcCD ATPase subunit
VSPVKKRSLTIYIHPDRGPVTPMTLDLDAVEVAINKVPMANSSDEAAVHAIAQQIRDKFNEFKLEIGNNRQRLAMIMRRWTYAQGFDGMVVRLQGPMNNKEGGIASTEISQSTLGELSRLTRTLESEKRVSVDLKRRVQVLEIEYKRFKSLYEQAKRELDNKRIQEQQTQAGKQQDQSAIQQALQDARDDADQAMQEAATLKLQLEQTQTQLRSQAHYEQEIADLRYKERSAQQSAQQEHESFQRLQQDYVALQEQIKQLTEGSSSEEARMDTDDDSYDL